MRRFHFNDNGTRRYRLHPSLRDNSHTCSSLTAARTPAWSLVRGYTGFAPHSRTSPIYGCSFSRELVRQLFYSGTFRQHAMDDEDDFDLLFSRRPTNAKQYVRAPRSDFDDWRPRRVSRRQEHEQPPLDPPQEAEAKPEPARPLSGQQPPPLAQEETDTRQQMQQGLVLLTMLLAITGLVVALSTQGQDGDGSLSTSRPPTRGPPQSQPQTTAAATAIAGDVVAASRVNFGGWLNEASPPPWPPWHSPPPLPPSPSPPSPKPLPPPPQRPRPSPPPPSLSPFHPPFPSFPLPKPPPNPPNPPPPPPHDCITCNNFPLPTRQQALSPEKCAVLLGDRNGKMCAHARSGMPTHDSRSWAPNHAHSCLSCPPGCLNIHRWSMWAAQGWKRRSKGGPACFEHGAQPPFSFESVLRGERCDRNWYEGVLPSTPTYPQPVAPALLGHDHTIFAYCSAQYVRRKAPHCTPCLTPLVADGVSAPFLHALSLSLSLSLSVCVCVCVCVSGY